MDHSYLGGFLAAQRDMPQSSRRLAPALTNDFDKAFFLRWFQKEKPDAVVVSAAYAKSAIEWLGEIGKDVPDDVGVAAASIPFGNSILAGIDENAPLIGQVAVDTVVGMIHRSDHGVPPRASSILLEGVWVEGKTVRKIPHIKKSSPV